MTPLAWFGALLLVIWLAIAGQLLTGRRRIASLRAIAPQLPAPVPRVSIVVAARNEARHLRSALASLLALDYPDLEYILVDDRSEDATGTILEEMAAADSRLRVVRVAKLPAGWLGKNHALWTGSRIASGEFLLFTDADILVEPSALARAIAYMHRHHLDHLAVTPEVRMPGAFLDSFTATFSLFFSLYFRPWRARDPRSAAHIGIGAFNLVRTAAYRQVGGHATIRLRPDDDVKLGKILKRGGFRQDVLFGTGLLIVEWYASVRELVHGLEKNAFAGTDYSIVRTLLGAGFQAVGCLWPYLALFCTDGLTWVLHAAIVAVISGILVDGAEASGGRRWHAISFPLTTGLFVFILLRTMFLNLAQGGIRWRGTFYPLRELKQNKI